MERQANLHLLKTVERIMESSNAVKECKYKNSMNSPFKNQSFRVLDQMVVKSMVLILVVTSGCLTHI